MSTAKRLVRFIPLSFLDRARRPPAAARQPARRGGPRRPSRRESSEESGGSGCAAGMSNGQSAGPNRGGRDASKAAPEAPRRAQQDPHHDEGERTERQLQRDPDQKRRLKRCSPREGAPGEPALDVLLKAEPDDRQERERPRRKGTHTTPAGRIDERSPPARVRLLLRRHRAPAAARSGSRDRSRRGRAAGRRPADRRSGTQACARPVIPRASAGRLRATQGLGAYAGSCHSAAHRPRTGPGGRARRALTCPSRGSRLSTYSVVPVTFPRRRRAGRRRRRRRRPR